MRPTAREELGADPMFRAWQDSGGQPHELPKRMRITYELFMFVSVAFVGGLFITLITAANWSLCVPIFAVLLACLGAIWYFSDRKKNKDPRP